MGNANTIKNGKELGSWVVVIFLIGGLIVSLILGWGDLRGQVKKNAEENTKTNAALKETKREIKREGTQISRQNRRDIIKMQVKIDYTAETIKKIAEKLNVIP